jgi:hypothetical protein
MTSILRLGGWFGVSRDVTLLDVLVQRVGYVKGVQLAMFPMHYALAKLAFGVKSFDEFATGPHHPYSRATAYRRRQSWREAVPEVELDAFADDLIANARDAVESKNVMGIMGMPVKVA